MKQNGSQPNEGWQRAGSVYSLKVFITKTAHRPLGEITAVIQRVLFPYLPSWSTTALREGSLEQTAAAATKENKERNGKER